MLENLDIFDTPLPKLDIGLNIFEQLDPKETEHSMILAEILKFKSQEDEYKFLKLFFEYVINSNEDNRNYLFNGNKIWKVTAEKDRYDIVIKSIDDETRIIIENKSNLARDGEHQVYNYWNWGIKSYKECKNGIILYLSPNEAKQPDNQTKINPSNTNESIDDKYFKIIYFYKHIIKWINECINTVEINSDIYFYLKQYRDFWRLKMSDNNKFFHDTFIGKKEQWYTFLEMTKQIGRIKNNWWEIFFKELNQNIEINENWEYKKVQNKYQSCWCIKNEKNKSDFFCLYLWLYDDNKIKLSIGLEENINISKEECKYISTILEKYKNTLEKIFDINKLERPINREDRKHKYVENCYFDNIKTDDILILTWYAHFEPNILYSAINLKIKNIIENKEMQDLMIEINEYIIKRN